VKIWSSLKKGSVSWAQLGGEHTCGHRSIFPSAYIDRSTIDRK